MINIIVTSYKEPKATLRAVRSLLNQTLKEDYKIIVVDPFPEVEKFLKKELKSKKVEFFLDPGEGKGYALNLLFQEHGTGNKKDIFVLTDGDVYVSKNAIQEIIKPFKDELIGCVTGKPVPTESTGSKYEYWAEIAFKRIDQVRKRLSNQKNFFECSGYLFAIRDGVIFDFPINTSEDSIIPYLFWKKNYLINYADKAEVYVKNPNNWTDWFNQKVRNIKAHENLNKLAPDMPRTKSLFNEIKEGAFFAILQPRSLKEFFWVIQFYFARLYIYLVAFRQLAKKSYKDGWRETEIESTKPLD
jgi:cellulose synthase/poly-beta-1,6-N-acetylglucosamine synthase-like glycosyltransferase